MTLEKGAKQIHVNQHIIKANVKYGDDRAAVTVQFKGKSYAGRDVVVYGASRIVQRMLNPLPCGARLWIETSSKVEVIQ